MAFPILALVIAFGGLAAHPAPTVAADQVKVVIVVGPVEGSTPRYKSAAKSYAALARSFGAYVVEVYSPKATWAKVKAAAKGANIFIYLGHGNGYPSPYGPFAADRRNGMGLNKTLRPRQLERQVLRPDAHEERPRSRAELGRPAQSPVLRIGQFRAGPGAAEQDHREQASRRLRHGLPAHRRQGRVRERPRQPVVDL